MEVAIEISIFLSSFVVVAVFVWIVVVMCPFVVTLKNVEKTELMICGVLVGLLPNLMKIHL